MRPAPSICMGCAVDFDSGRKCKGGQKYKIHGWRFEDDVELILGLDLWGEIEPCVEGGGRVHKIDVKRFWHKGFLDIKKSLITQQLQASKTSFCGEILLNRPVVIRKVDTRSGLWVEKLEVRDTHLSRYRMYLGRGGMYRLVWATPKTIATGYFFTLTLT